MPTGTPVENRLSEFWSQFNFLMPGALGDYKTFGKIFRKPIEKHNDVDRQEVLASRFRPFMLRRTKQEIAPELPEKSTIIRRVELEGDQCDLYETIRSAMQRKVHKAIAEKGLNQCQIIIFDALLKLRQVCCDPRLVNLEEAKAVRSSAKLDTLMDMLPDLLEKGRRILLFSQFTSMLDLIATECQSRGIEFVTLRGDTADRETPVKHFQAGLVPLFLISLKAGGKGINLTAADTVIHYDPWWNPAAEDQATDRAYRIGQDKNVFVYKLIASGTQEERMLYLQERKRALAESVFDRHHSGKLAFDESDLALLFSPLGLG